MPIIIRMIDPTDPPTIKMNKKLHMQVVHFRKGTVRENSLYIERSMIIIIIIMTSTIERH